jgi:hypothetical protein
MSKRNLEAIAAAIAALADPDGHTPLQRIIDTARDPDHILHHEFEWNVDVLVQQALEARSQRRNELLSRR